MKRNVLGRCPVCSSQLDVTELHCSDCHTTIKGEFKLDKFNYLSKEEKYFIEIFVKNRGNIKEIEKDLGVKLDYLIRALFCDSIELAGAKQCPYKIIQFDT